MITLTAEINFKTINPYPFILGESTIDYSFFGYDYYYMTEIIDKKNIISMESEIRDRAEMDKPSFGLISSSGRISFSDNDTRFLRYVENGMLKGNEPITIFLKNTISGKSEKVGSYFASNWKYDSYNKTFDVNLNGSLLDLQEIYVETYDKTEISKKTAYDIYWHLKSLSEGKGFNVYSEPFDEEFYMRTFSIEYPYIEGGTLWSQWEKFCKSFGFYMYIDKVGDIFLER